MKLLTGAASLLALALFVTPIMAEDAPIISDQPVVEQAAPAVDLAAPAIPEDVLALLSDSRSAQDLTDDELVSRFKRARRFAKDGTLTEDVRSQLQTIADAARTEMDVRKQAQQQPAQQEQPAPVTEPPQQEQQAAPAEVPAAPEAKPAIPEEVSQLLNDGQDLSALDIGALKQRAKMARRFAKQGSLPQDVVDRLNAIAQDARIEVTKREAEAQQLAPEKQPEQQQAQPEPAPVVEPPAEKPIVVQEAPPAAEAVQPVAVEPPPAPPAKVDVQALDNNAGDPESEKQARAYLEDQTSLDNLSDDDLRTRLDSIRDVMASNELSRDTERAVRKKLKAERDVLRQRLAAKEASVVVKEAKIEAPVPLAPIETLPATATAATPAVALPPPPPPPPPLPPVQVNNTTVNNTTINNTVIITNITPAPIVLRDLRPAEDLQVSELQRRLQVYNEAQFDEDYDQANRDYWRQSMARDREILRRRMVEERRRRAQELTLEASNGSIDININIDFSPSRPPPPRYVFAAEVDDQEMEDILVALPRKSIKKRYNVEEIAVQPRLRDSVSRIEIDTIRFGYNESFVREEQLDSLDGIAAIIERIVKKYPNEVFMIEGHTDAPGSDAYNNRLSKLRAEAIKKALVSYYVIPARNLRTVGLGERFLKIPTADAEPENRRVSISRITNLLSAN